MAAIAKTTFVDVHFGMPISQQSHQLYCSHGGSVSVLRRAKVCFFSIHIQILFTALLVCQACLSLMTSSHLGREGKLVAVVVCNCKH